MRPAVRMATVGATAVLLGMTACTTGAGGPDAVGSNGSGTSTTAGQGSEATTPTRSTPPVPTTTPLVPRSFTLGASGDILVHVPVMRSARANAHGRGYDFDPMFDDVRAMISGADLAICHQETPISADGTNLTAPGTLSFNAPPQIATALKGAGFDACSTASNHTYDRRVKGVHQTLQVLERAGLEHSGSSRNATEAANPPIYVVSGASGASGVNGANGANGVDGVSGANGVKVGHLAYSYDIYNTGGPDTRVPPDVPWLRAMLWPVLGKDGILAAAAQLRARGAEVVVISIHWGDQYVHRPNAQQVRLAHDLLSSPDVDLILGAHAHVIQPCEKVDGKYVIYGMGNFLSNQAPGQAAGLKVDNQDGGYFQWRITEVAPKVFRATSMSFAPTFVRTSGHRILRATPAINPSSHDRTARWVASLGPTVCDAKALY